MTTTLDDLYGIVKKPEKCAEEERHVEPESLTILGEAEANGLKSLMEATDKELPLAASLFSQVLILWLIDADGCFRFALEEVVTTGSKRYLRPRLRRDRLSDGETRLGHPSLVSGVGARIGGELCFDPGWGHERRGWKLTNGSGRYGTIPGRTSAHLSNVAALLKAHGISVTPIFYA